MKLKACFFTFFLVCSISNMATAKFWGQDNSQSAVHRAADGNCYVWQENDYYILWIKVSNGGQWIQVDC